MTNSPRDRLILLLLPSCLVLMIYAWRANDKKQPALAQLRQGLEAEQARAVGPALVRQQQARLSAVQAELADLEKQKQGLTQQWQETAALFTQTRSRPERADRFNALLTRNRLTLIESGPAESGRESRPSGGPEKLAKLIAERTGGQLPQVWRYRLQGRYVDVMNTLEELSRDEPLAVPIGLTMKEADPDSSAREWTLLVWI